MAHDHHFAANLSNWDERAVIHAADESGFYELAALRQGHDTLDAIACGIGDVRGLRVAHLQCHIGTDSVCLAKRGASVTGLDFSPAALKAARELAEELKRDCRFVEGNVYDARALLDGEFDRVFVTWGAINWLPDIARWAKTVASILKPGGQLFLAEAHPTTLCFDWVDGQIAPGFDLRTPQAQPIAEDLATTYNDTQTQIRSTRTYEWMHALSDILNGLIAAGMRIDRFDEHEALPWAPFPNLVKGPDVYYRFPPGHPRLPLSFSLTATKG
jgi:ubiquinone/menaquinone biosynthesis C-methylase UbiE